MGCRGYAGTCHVCIMWDEMNWERVSIGDDAGTGTGTDTDSHPPSAWVAVPIHSLGLSLPGALGWTTGLALDGPTGSGDPFAVLVIFVPFWLGGAGAFWPFSGGLLASPGVLVPFFWGGPGLPRGVLWGGCAGVRSVGWCRCALVGCRGGCPGWFPVVG